MSFGLAGLRSIHRQLPTAYWPLWVGTVVNRVGGFVAPFLTLYLTTGRGISPSHAAMTVSLFGAGSFVSQLVGGELADRYGRRPVMLLSFLSAPVAMVALGLSQALPVIMVTTLCLGFTTDLYRPAVNAAVADLVEPRRRPMAFGYLYWAINVGAAIAPVLAGLLARYDYFLLFLGDAITTLLFGLIVLARVPETRPLEAAHTESRQSSGRLSQLRSDHILLAFTALALVFGIVYTQGFVTLPLDMQSHGLSPADYGIAAAVNGALIVLITLRLSRAAERRPRFTVMSASAIVLGVGFGITAAARTLPAFALSVAIWTIGEILAASIAPTIVSDLAPPAMRGLYQGIFGSAWGLAHFVGPVLGGLTFEHLGANTLWMGCLAAGGLVGIGYLAMARPAGGRLSASTTAAT